MSFNNEVKDLGSVQTSGWFGDDIELSHQHDRRDRVAVKIDVSLDRCGHVPPFLNGTMVSCRYNGGSVIDVLDTSWDENGKARYRSIPMSKSMTGVVVDRVWHLDKNELLRSARIDQVYVSSRTVPHVHGVEIFLFYQVMFSCGLYWARYDWLERVQVDEVSNAKA